MGYSPQARLNMIKNQLEPSGVVDPALLQIIYDIPREDFVPQSLAESAYLDEELPLGYGRHLLEPRALCRMIQAADISETDSVLDVGCGSGYSTAIIASIAQKVVAIESAGELAEIARRNLRKLEIKAELFCTSLSGGYALKAPYDVIFINGAVEEINDELAKQLKEGGVIIGVQAAGQYRMGEPVGIGTVTKWHCHEGVLHAEPLFEAAVPVLDDFKRKPSFTF